MVLGADQLHVHHKSVFLLCETEMRNVTRGRGYWVAQFMLNGQSYRLPSKVEDVKVGGSVLMSL